MGRGSGFAETVERIVAKVNGQIITFSELEKQVKQALEQLGPPPDGVSPQERVDELRSQMLNSMVDNMLVLQVADQRGLRVPSRFFEEWKQGVMKEMGIESEEEFERAQACATLAG